MSQDNKFRMLASVGVNWKHQVVSRYDYPATLWTLRDWVRTKTASKDSDLGRFWVVQSLALYSSTALANHPEKDYIRFRIQSALIVAAIEVGDFPLLEYCYKRDPFGEIDRIDEMQATSSMRAVDLVRSLLGDEALIYRDRFYARFEKHVPSKPRNGHHTLISEEFPTTMSSPVPSYFLLALLRGSSSADVLLFLLKREPFYKVRQGVSRADEFDTEMDEDSERPDEANDSRIHSGEPNQENGPARPGESADSEALDSSSKSINHALFRASSHGSRGWLDLVLFAIARGNQRSQNDGAMVVKLLEAIRNHSGDGDPARHVVDIAMGMAVAMQNSRLVGRIQAENPAAELRGEEFGKLMFSEESECFRRIRPAFSITSLEMQMGAKISELVDLTTKALGDGDPDLSFLKKFL